MELGKNISELRKKSGMSQEELAYELDVARQTISKWESGDTVPDIYQTIKLSNIFEIDINELIGIERVAYDKVHNKAKRRSYALNIIWIMILSLAIYGVGMELGRVMNENRIHSETCCG